mgnify:CR=1 FL=1
MKFLLSRKKFLQIEDDINNIFNTHSAKNRMIIKKIVKSSILHFFIGNLNKKEENDQTSYSFLAFLKKTLYFDILYIAISFSYLFRWLIASKVTLKSSLLFLLLKEYHYKKNIGLLKFLRSKGISYNILEESGFSENKNNIKNKFNFYSFIFFIKNIIIFRFATYHYLLTRREQNYFDLWAIKYLPLMLLKYSQCLYILKAYDFKIMISVDPTDPLIKLLEVISCSEANKEAICFPLGYIIEGDPYWLYDHNIFYGTSNYGGTKYLKKEHFTTKEIKTVGDSSYNLFLKEGLEKKNKNIIFFSTPSRKKINQGGEFQVSMESYCKVFETIIKITIENNLKLIIKLHPQDNNHQNIKSILSKYKNIDYKIYRDIELHELFKKSFSAFGFKSNTFFESIINDVPYFVIDLEEKDDYFKIREFFSGIYLNSINDLNNNFIYFQNNRNFFIEKWRKSVKLYIENNFPLPLNQSTDRTFKFIKKVLDQV